MTDPQMPAFWRRLTDLYSSGVSHAFLLHGNVRDYVPMSPYPSLVRFVVAAAARSRDILITLDPATGLDVPIPAHRAVLQGLLTAPTAPKSPLVQILANGLRPDAPLPRNDATQSLKEVSSLLDWLLSEQLMIPDVEPRPVRIGVVVDFADFILPDADLTKVNPAVLTRFIKWAQSLIIGEHHLLLMLCESLSGVHSELRRASARWEAIDLALPTLEERTAFIVAKWHGFGVTSDLQPEAVARMTGGLTLLAIEDILLRGSDQTLTEAMISERKQSLIKSEYGDVIQIVDPRWTLATMGGYDYLKTWFARTIERPWAAGNLRVGGVLMSGPPGTGKTTLAEGMAGSLQIPFIVFRLSRILGQYVGTSERALERALQAFLSLAPAIVFIDELDQTVRRGEGNEGSGVDNRVFARLLEFLEDPARRGKLLIVAATNRPDLLDAALRSRFDRTVPVLPPTDEDRPWVVLSQCAMQGLAVDQDAAEALARPLHGWTGRNLRDLVAIAAELHDDEGLSPNVALEQAISLYRPPLGDVLDQIRLALRELTDLRLVPPHYRHLIAGEAAPEQSPPAALAAPETRKKRTL